MKFQLTLSAFLLLFSAWSNVNKSVTDSVEDESCQTIIDSAKAFNQTSEFAVNFKPTIKDRERNLRLDKWLQSLSFKSFTCLINSDDLSLKTLGFIYAANFHTDSLMNHYAHLLTDTTTAQFFSADGDTSPKMKLGEILSIMAAKIKEDKDAFAKRPEIEAIVSDFIRKYSSFPETYKPISFPYFSMSSDNEGLRGFDIRHNYEMKNNKGEIQNVTYAFALDKNLRISVIEKDSSSTSYSYPSNLKSWLNEFGRALTKEDSLALRLR